MDNSKYVDNVGLFKALADPNRLMIVDMLSCGELCACDILEKFNITQPTLSHHMKILCDCGLVQGRKEGKWTHYSLNAEKAEAFKQFICYITTNTKDRICNEGVCSCERQGA